MFTKKQVLHGLYWKNGGMVYQFGIQLLVKLALAYYLLPEDFGIIGMAAVFVALITMYTDLGIAKALIQRKEENLTRAHYNSLFWFNMGICLLAFVTIAFGVGHLGAWYYNESLIYPVCIGLSLSLLWSPLGFIHTLRLQKELQFKKLFVINFISVTLGGVGGILMAMNGYGVWSLVGQSIISSVIRLPVLWLMVIWKPRFAFSWQPVKDLLGFGLYDVGARFIGFFNTNMNVLILATLFSPAIVGYFVFAEGLTVGLLKQINSSVKKVFFPFFSGIQNDRTRIKSYFLAQIDYVALIIFPFSCGLIYLSEPFITVIFGDKWAGAVIPLQYLAAFLLVVVMEASPGTVFLSLGHAKLNMKLSFVKYILIRIPFVVVGGIVWGFTGYLSMLVVSQAAILLVDLCFLKKLIDVSIFDILYTVRETAICCLLMAGSLFLFKLEFQIGNIVELITSIILGVVVFVSSYMLFFGPKARLYLEQIRG